MKAEYIYILIVLIVSHVICSCDDEDSFSMSTSDTLTFSADTIKLDTVFSTVPSSTRSFWVYNKSGSGLRNINVRLENGNQAGFRVNVDGTYLSPSSGFQTNGIEVRNKDSIRVFVELTSPVNNGDKPLKIEDNIVFTLESGIRQKVNLTAYSWDATIMKNVVIDNDSIFDSVSKPIVVYGGITVTDGSTLTISPGTTIYFHGDAGMNVYGRLNCLGEAGREITLRGDRLDNMFDYLPYDYVSGQWLGIRFYETSYDNEIRYTDIHGTFDGIRVDSADVSRPKLVIENSTIHNCQGYALTAESSNLIIKNCEFTNTLHNCIAIKGGKTDINNCTFAQFYPFDSNRGSAFYFSEDKYPQSSLICANSIITGYADDEMMIQTASDEEEKTAAYLFDHCIIRTPKITTEDSVRFADVIFEEYEDTVKTGVKHFRKIDSQNLRYDFRLDSISPAINAADPATAALYDRCGAKRDERPDVGAYEYFMKSEHKRYRNERKRNQNYNQKLRRL